MGCVSSSVESKYEISNMVKESDFIDKRIDNVEEFNLNDQLILARVVDVYDCNTLICIINVCDKFYRFKIKLAEVDMENIKNKEHQYYNKEVAKVNRNVLYTLITNDKTINAYEGKTYIIEKLKSKCYLVKLYCCNFDKNGMLIAYVFNKNFIFNNIENNKGLIQYNKTFSYNYYLIDQDLALYYNK